MLRGFVLKFQLECLGLVVVDRASERLRQVQLALLERGNDQSEVLQAPIVGMDGSRPVPGLWTPGNATPELARIVNAGLRELSRNRPGIRRIFGRPWPLAALAFCLALQLLPGFVRPIVVVAFLARSTPLAPGALRP